MDSGPWILPVLLQAALIAVNAVFSCAEFAVVSVGEAKLEKILEDGDKRAKTLLKLKRQPARLLSTIQVAITLAGFLGSAFAADSFSDRLVSLLARAGIQMHSSVAIILITLILSYFSLVFGELVPKRLAMKNPEGVALGISKVLYVISIIFFPLVWLLSVSTNGVLRLMGIDPNAEENEVTEDEIRLMVDAGNEKGTIDEDEKEMIQNVFEFDDITADEICTRRMDCTILYEEDPVEEWRQTIHESRHTLFPFCRDTADNVIGVLNAKDFFRVDSDNKEDVIAETVKPAYFVPGSIKADALFSNMRRTGNYFAIVLDEYGGMDGIVTVRDVIEEVVGDIIEPDDEAKPKDIVQISEYTWRVQGSAQLDEVADKLKVDLPLEEYDTFGGYIFGVLGEIPEDGTRFEVDTDDLHIRVFEIRDHRIEGTIVRVHKKTDEEEKDSDSDAGKEKTQDTGSSRS
ncbi:MAG: hemolysin family protein [Bilifractor sp.]